MEAQFADFLWVGMRNVTEYKNESDGELVNCKLIRERLKLTCQGCVMLLGNLGFGP